MSVNEIVLNDYFYPFNQLTEQDFVDHRFIRLPQHCCVSSTFVTNGNFGPIFTALKVDRLQLLKKFVESKHITETWLKFCSNINYKNVMFFNINIKYGYKVVASTKAVYGHNAMLIIPSDIDKTSEISKYIETHFRQETILSKIFDCFGSPFYLLFPKPQSGLRYDTTVHLLFNYTKEFNVSLSQTLKDLKRLVQKPLNIIALDPHETATSNLDQHEIAGDVLNLILMGLKIRYAIEKDFPVCTGFSVRDKGVNVNDVISEISTQQLKLATAMGLRRSHEAKEIITEIYKNVSSLLHSIFSQYANYFKENFENDSTVIFPKIPFAETLLEDCKKIFYLLKHNFSMLNEKIFFKWNESTRLKMASDGSENFENYGIIVTEESFENLKEMYDNFESNVFWGLNLSVNFNNIEPLIFIGNRETLFGFAEGISAAAANNEEKAEGEELLFTPCSCQCLQFRHWICRNCWSLYKVVDAGHVCCGCEGGGAQKIPTLQKECFQCILNSKINVSSRRHRSSGSKDFKEARDQLSNFFKLQDPPKKRPKKLKKVEIIPPDPITSSFPKATYIPPPPPLAPAASFASTSNPPQAIPQPLADDITIALEQLHEKVKVATELCDDVLQKVGKKEIPDIPKVEVPEVVIEEPIGEPLKVLKQKVEEALEYVEEIKEHEESKANSEA